MFPDHLLLDLACAFLGGALAASVGALGGFILFGLVGVTGFLSLLLGGDAAWLQGLTGTVLLRPSSCFLGGAVAAAWARRSGLLRCGKDIGRPLLEFRNPTLLLVGGLAGIAGFLANLALDAFLAGKVDTVGLVVFGLPLLLKQIWGLGRSSDCAATSHAVPSPYRFFERLATRKGKPVVCLLSGLGAATLTLALATRPDTAPYAALAAFCLSSASLVVLHLGIPVPVTHHYTGPAGAAVVSLAPMLSSLPPMPALLCLLGWALLAAALGLAGADLLGRLWFDEGDIHVDPPAMGIVVSTAVVLGLLPVTGVLQLPPSLQTILACGGIVLCCLVPTFLQRAVPVRRQA